MTTVLVTGAAGYIGSYVLPALREQFTLRLVDNRDVDGRGQPVDGLQVVDLSDLRRIEDLRPLSCGADGRPAVGERRAPNRRLGVVQIRIGAPRDLAIATLVDERRDDPKLMHRDLGMWVSPRDLSQLFIKSIEAASIDNEHGVPF